MDKLALKVAARFVEAVAKKVPLSQRTPKEQARYHTGTALSALGAGMPSAAVESLHKAIAIVAKDPSLKAVHPLLTKALAAATGPSPRAADSIVEHAYRLLKA